MGKHRLLPVLGTALCCVGACFFLAACSKRPVLLDNAKYNEVGKSQAEADIEECMKRAEEQGAIGETKVEKAVFNAGRGGAAGAAGGAVTGAIYNGKVGRGLAAGAAGGAASAFIWYLFDREPDQVFKHYVDYCLRQKGYHPIGWGLDR